MLKNNFFFAETRDKVYENFFIDKSLHLLNFLYLTTADQM